MTKEQQLKMFDELVSKMRETIASKGDDYSNEDRLSNFKNVARRTSSTPENVCITQIGIKIERITNLLSGKTPNNESVEDTILDMANYCILLHMIYKENNKKDNVVDITKRLLKIAGVKSEILANPILQIELVKGIADGRLNEKLGKEILCYCLGAEEVEIKCKDSQGGFISRPHMDVKGNKVIFYI